MQARAFGTEPVGQAARFDDGDIGLGATDAQQPGGFERAEGAAGRQHQDLAIPDMIGEHHGIGALLVDRAGEKNQDRRRRPRDPVPWWS